MSGDREMTSEQSLSVRKGADYDEFYPLGREPEEDVTWSPEREPSAHSPVEEEEKEYEKGGKGRGRRERGGK